MSGQPAKFLQGNLMRHISVMTASASIGLVSVFLVDFVDLYFISLLGKNELAAAVGFAGTLLFMTISMNVGFMIAVSALTARRIGAGDADDARRIAASIAVISVIVGLITGGALFFFAETFIRMLGASGETVDLAARYLRIIAPTMPFASLSMVASGILRAHGDARRAMNATLVAGIVNAVFDPILIFWAGLGLDGAAIASVLARLAMFATAMAPVLRHYGGFAKIDVAQFKSHLKPITGIAAPAILTNLATPIGTIFVTRAVAPFGDGAVAGYAVISRLTPLVFCGLFALSGAIGPIIGQNFGARQFDRVRESYIKAIGFAGAYAACAWIILLAANQYIVNAFGLEGEGARLVFWFAVAAAPLFFFSGALFATNAAFNNLNRPVWSTGLNWARNTLGVLPFVMVGANIGGASGVIVAHAVGGILFAVFGVWLALRLMDAYSTGKIDPDENWRPPLMRPRPTPPFSSPRG